MINSIFFDFDGVLTTEESGSLATSKFLQQRTGVNYKIIHNSYKEIFQRIDIKKNVVTEKNWKKVCKKIDIEIPFEILKYAIAHPPKNDKMINLIYQLKHRYKIGLITDNSEERVALLKETYQLEKLFKTITVSATVGALKTEQKIFKTAIAELGVNANESIFIDNRKKNLTIPKQMGFKTYLYNHEFVTIFDLKKILAFFGVKIK